MPASGINQEYQSFKGGLFTEGNELQAPQETTKDESNMTLTFNGNREVRVGIDYETGGNARSVGSFGALRYVTTFIWKSPGNDSSKEFLVIHAGTSIFIFDSKATPIIAASALHTVTLPSGVVRRDFTAQDGNLIYNSGTGYAVVAYDGSSFTNYTGDVQIRDLFGIDDTLTVEERPGTLTGDHKYNLYNQGWFSQVENAAAAAVYPIDEWNTVKADYPSNADVWNIYRNTSEQFVPAQDLKVAIGNTPAPKGHFLIGALGTRGTDRQNAVGASAPVPDRFSNTTAGPATLTGNTADNDTGNFSCVESHAGRLFLSGVESSITGADDLSPDFTEYVFFSQVSTNYREYGTCYQAADPTNEFDSALVATDGGFIPVKGVGRVLRMKSFGDNLIVFGNKAVYGIIGGAGGFTASDNYVYRIANVGLKGVESIVETPTAVYAWLETGIFVFTVNPDSSTIIAASITDQTIQSKVAAIADAAVQESVGAYDKFSKKIHWAYGNDTIVGTTNYRHLKDRVLTYDTRYTSFTEEAYSPVTTSPSQEGPYILSLFPLPTKNSVSGFSVSSIGYLAADLLDNTVGTYTLTLYVAKQLNTDFLDWYTHDTAGATYSAYLESQQLIPGDTQRKKRPIYLMVHCKRTEQNFIDNGSGQPTLDDPSSCKIQARWDFSDSATSGKWDTEFEAYRFLRAYIPGSISEPFDYGQEVITTKNKIRGSGRALTLRVSNTPGSNLKLLGVGLTGLVQNSV